MFTRVATAPEPDYAASPWLRSLACGHVPGDPASPRQFAAAAAFLELITGYFSDISGPWCATTPQDIRDVHHDYLVWCARASGGNPSWSPPPVPFALQHLHALSLRRLFALSEAGGAQREEYPLFHHLHRAICAAAGYTSPSRVLEAAPPRRVRNDCHYASTH